MTVNDIDKQIKSINNNNDIDEEKFEITVYVEKGKTNKIVIITKEAKIEIQKIESQNNLEYSIILEAIQNNETAKISLIAKYSGLAEMQEVLENYEIGVETSGIAYRYQLNNNVKFGQGIEIEEFTDDNSLLLTNYEQEQVSNFINAVVERITLVNKDQMEQLGLKENENPLIQGILMPITQINIAKISGGAIKTNNMSELEVNTFNQKFEMYASTNLKGVTVKGLISVISRNNGLEEIEDGNELEIENTVTHEIKEINYNGQEYEVNKQNLVTIKESIDLEKSYRVEFEKDQDTGIIYRAVINAK